MPRALRVPLPAELKPINDMDVAHEKSSLSTESTPPTSGLFRWLTPWRCRLIFVALLAWGVWGHIQYLNNNCPLDLAGDEAQYWDWSRALGLSYYSKGPLIAYIIRASCAIFGNTMPAVRYPAMVLAVGTSFCTYWLILKLFKSDRIALGAALISHAMPVLVAGSIMMTIDPPFFFLWALATCFAAKAIIDDKPKFWPVVGLVVGVGFLAKYAMFIWPIGLVAFLLIDKPARHHLKSKWFWSAFVVALACTTPVVIWNIQHGGVTALHVIHQTGDGFNLANPLAMLGTQAMIIGLGIFITLVAAVRYVLTGEGRRDPHYRAMLYLLLIGLSIFAICFLDSFRGEIQPNWPAPAYFTGMILVAYFLSLRLWHRSKTRGFWRFNTILSLLIGLAFVPLAHDFSLVYPYVPKLNAMAANLGRKKPLTARAIDPTYKMRGVAELGDRVSEELAALGPDAFVIADKYQDAAQMAFYVKGQPRTFVSGPYKSERPARLNQYDMWPDRSLEPDKTTMLGKDAIYIGDYTPDLEKVFAKVTPLLPKEIYRRGQFVQRYQLFKCEDFKGWKRPDNTGKF